MAIILIMYRSVRTFDLKYMSFNTHLPHNYPQIANILSNYP